MPTALAPSAAPLKTSVPAHAAVDEHRNPARADFGDDLGSASIVPRPVSVERPPWFETRTAVKAVIDRQARVLARLDPLMMNFPLHDLRMRSTNAQSIAGSRRWLTPFMSMPS